MQRQVHFRPKITWADRALIAVLRYVLPRSCRAGARLIVSPATLLRWHRDIVRRCWARKSQHKRPGRPELLPAGNVETSMATAGSLYAALGVQAEVAGTMNNLTFGNEHRQYIRDHRIGIGRGRRLRARRSHRPT